MYKYTLTIPFLNDSLTIKSNSLRIYRSLTLLNGTSTQSPFSLLTVYIEEQNSTITMGIKDQNAVWISFPSSRIKSTEDLFFIIKFYIQKYGFNFNGVLLHGSAVFYKKSVYIFTGKSGSGKTTIVKNSNLPVIADDMCLITIEKNKAFVQRSKLDVSVEKKMDIKVAMDKKFPLLSIFLLKQARENNIQSVSSIEKLDILVNNSLTFLDKILPPMNFKNLDDQKIKRIRENEQQLSKKLLSIVSSVQIYKLFFTKDFIFRPEKLKLNK